MASGDWLPYGRGDFRVKCWRRLRLRALNYASGAPTGLLDYAQETGHAGRDGAPVDCLILLPPGWRVTWESGFYNNFLAENRMRMTNFLRSSKQCFGRQLTAYLDGGHGISCRDNPGPIRLLCSSCRPPFTPSSRLHVVAGPAFQAPTLLSVVGETASTSLAQCLRSPSPSSSEEALGFRPLGLPESVPVGDDGINEGSVNRSGARVSQTTTTTRRRRRRRRRRLVCLPYSF
jgi:hypothetical protein